VTIVNIRMQFQWRGDTIDDDLSEEIAAQIEDAVNAIGDISSAEVSDWEDEG
jgi:hypothetical protein